MNFATEPVSIPSPLEDLRCFKSVPITLWAMEWNGTKERYEELVRFTDELVDEGYAQQFLILEPDDPELMEVIGEKRALEALEQGYTAMVFDELHDAWIPVKTGDYIICGTQGEFYPIRPEVMAVKYEEVLNWRQE